MARPGIMLYFDIRQPLKVLPDADKGRLLDALLEYGEFGVIPEFDPQSDGLLAMAWGFIQPKLDRDGASYDNAVAQRKYAAFCKKLGALDLPKLSFTEWKDLTEEERERMVTAVDGRDPTVTVTPTRTKTISITPTGTPTSEGTRSVPRVQRPEDPDDPEDFEAMRRQKLQMLQGMTD